MRIEQIIAERNPAGRTIYVARDDLYPRFFGGNKARKMDRIIPEIEEGGFDAVVTTGGIHSNHCRVAALACAEMGWACRLILHGSRERFYAEKGNALLIRRAGAATEFVTEDEIGPSMDRAMDELTKAGRKPYYLYGGGHNASGVLAYRDALIEFDKAWLHEEPPSCIILASGTGSTQAGLLAGCWQLGWKNTRVRGISVARERKKGLAAIRESLGFIGELPEIYRDELYFDDAFLFGGYGLSTPVLNEFTELVAAGSGLILDTTYTGKAFYGMTEFLAEEKPRGEVVFWHTGGLLNLMR